jgi:transcriptional regulator of acetoin/glycerol metabolism
LLNYDYPGNVRELENILEHALIICQEDAIQLAHLPEYLQSRPAARKALSSGPDAYGFPQQNKERAELLAMLQQNSWNRQKTARALGVDRTTLWRKMKKYGLLN